MDLQAQRCGYEFSDGIRGALKMAEYVKRGNLFSVVIGIDEDRIKRFKKSPEAMEAAVKAGAFYWHTNILPEHFTTGAHAKYGYAPRTADWLRKKGNTPDLVRTGSMKRDLLARAAAQRVGKEVRLKMFSRVLNLVPKMSEDSADFYVSHSNKGKKASYPNMKREIHVMLDSEREAIAQVVAAEFERAVAPSDELRTIK